MALLGGSGLLWEGGITVVAMLVLIFFAMLCDDKDTFTSLYAAAPSVRFGRPFQGPKSESEIKDNKERAAVPSQTFSDSEVGVRK